MIFVLIKTPDKPNSIEVNTRIMDEKQTQEFIDSEGLDIKPSDIKVKEKLDYKNWADDQNILLIRID